MYQNLPTINLEDYNYDLPDKCIAKFANEVRGQSKLLVYKKGQIQKTSFQNILNYLPQDTHLVFNNTKVVRARLFFENTNKAQIEILLHNPLESDYQKAFNSEINSKWNCIIGNKKRWKKDATLNKIIIIDGIEILLEVSYHDYENNILEFSWKPSQHSITFSRIIEEVGKLPIPPYLNREPIPEDLNNYQTVFSKELGAVAAPTAGLHFTNEIIDSLAENNFSFQFITLHVGAGTFLPIKENDILNHKMHKEQIIFTLVDIELLIQKLGNIIPVGTTSLRAVESLYWFGVNLSSGNIPSKVGHFFIEKLSPYSSKGEIKPQDSLEIVCQYMKKHNLNKIIGETEIFIFPSYKFKISNGLITNFHQPKSTLLLLISALVGSGWKDIYQFALKNEFKFLSFGDSSLLLPT